MMVKTTQAKQNFSGNEGNSNTSQLNSLAEIIYSLIVILYLSTIYNRQREGSHKIQRPKVIKQDFVDKKGEISCVLTTHVSMKFSNKLIFILTSILNGGFDDEKTTCS